MNRRTTRLAPPICLRQQGFRDVWQRLSMVLMLVMLTSMTAFGYGLTDSHYVFNGTWYTGSNTYEQPAGYANGADLGEIITTDGLVLGAEVKSWDESDAAKHLPVLHYCFDYVKDVHEDWHNDLTIPYDSWDGGNGNKFKSEDVGSVDLSGLALGPHTITVYVSKLCDDDNTVVYDDNNGSYYTASFTLIKAIDVPTAVAGLVYDGDFQTGVAAGTGYTLDGDDQAVAAGNYTVTAKLDPYYQWSDGSTNDVEITWSIGKKDLTVTANDHSITYGDAPTNNGVSYSGFVEGEDESDLGGTLAYAYSYSQYGDVGNAYTITPSGLTAANYDITFASGTLTVAKKSLTITANDHTIFYGSPAENNGVSYVGFVNGDENRENVLTGELTYTYTNSEGNYGEGNDDPGEYAITPGGLSATNYDIEFRTGTLTVVAVTVKVSVVDIDNGENISGANVQVLDGEEKVAEWESGTGSHEVGGLRASKTYTIRETAVPDGYILPSDYTFTINENGDVSSYSGNRSEDVMLVENSKTHVEISVVDTADGEELTGAHILVLDSESNVIKEWNSTTETYVIEGLSTGEEYTIHETAASEGYILPSDYTFTIATNGTVTYSGTKTTDESGNTVLLVQNSMTHVEVSVVDKHNSEKIAGGHVQVIDTNGDIFEEWDSTTGNHVIEGLKTGEEYTIHETEAPEGFLLSSDYTFTIDQEGKITSNGPTTVESGKTVLLVENDMCINLSVTISWNDDDDKYGVRPATVTVTLSDGTNETSYPLDNNSNPLTCTVEDLQKYKNGTEINYSWTITDEIDCYEQSEPQVEGTTTTFTMNLIDHGDCRQPGSEAAVNWSYNTTTKTITIGGTGQMMYYNSVYNGETYSNGAPWKAYANEIENVVIEDGITYVGSNTFAHCPNISCVTLPTDQQLYEIGPGAFGDCTSLTSIDLPMSVNKIYDGAFAGCSNLKTVRLGYGDATHVVTIGKDVFPVTTTIIVPDETAYNAYMNAATWNGTATGEDENKTDYTRLLAPAVITLDGNTSGWTTYCHKYSVSYSVEDGAAYTVSGINDSYVETAAAENVAPYTPTLVYKSGGNVTLTALPATATQNVPTNYNTTTGLVTQDGDGFTFVGATTTPVEDCITDGQSYALYGGEFLKIDDSTLDIPAHRCILTLNEQPQYSAPRLSIVQDSGEMTGIDSISTESGSQGVFGANAEGNTPSLRNSLDRRNLSGQRVGAGYKGIVIVNGRKVVIK